MNGSLLILFIFSMLNMNLALQCAMGIKGAAESKNCSRKSTIIRLGIIFITVVFLWLFFTGIVFQIFSGIFIYILIFPVSFIVYEGFQYLTVKYIIKKDIENESFINFAGGITAVSVFICINISTSFFQTVILSFGFTSGIMVVFLIIREIRRRAALEAIPPFLRGNPLILISMGLLSIVFNAASVLFLRMMGS
jgi:Na+-translocating ferredoxin:NAD+ oxidoreductase RnfA subunit